MHSPLDLPTVLALSEHATHPGLQSSAHAWLAAYNLARQLAFTEAIALRQADTAWDRATEAWRRRQVGEEPVYELAELDCRGIRVRC